MSEHLMHDSLSECTKWSEEDGWARVARPALAVLREYFCEISVHGPPYREPCIAMGLVECSCGHRKNDLNCVPSGLTTQSAHSSVGHINLSPFLSRSFSLCVYVSIFITQSLSTFMTCGFHKNIHHMAAAHASNSLCWLCLTVVV